MSLLCNPDWESAKRSFAGWWSGTNTTRPLLQVLASRNGPETVPRPPEPESAEDRWLDAEYRMDLFEHEVSRTFYGGDAFAYFDPQLGPGTMALYVGSPPTFKKDTVWYGRIYDDIRTAPLPEFDENNEYWRWTLRTTEEAVKRFKGKALVSTPDLIEHVDILASLTGAQELLFYMADCPGHVHRLLERLTELYFEYYDRLYNLIKDDEGGSCFSAFNIWGPGKTAKLQCDYAEMISPAMFREFAQPYLREQCRRLDYSLYHWDGYLQHLDALLEIEELTAIQWTPPANQPGPADPKWWPIYHRIIDAGKSIMVIWAKPKEVEPLFEEFGPERLHIIIRWIGEEEARSMLADIG